MRSLVDPLPIFGSLLKTGITRESKAEARGDDMFIQMLGSAAEHMLEHGALDGLA